MKLFPQQQQALEAIQAFLDDKDQSVFILRGYAGTGKTTMIKAIEPLLHEQGKSMVLMAPTGRAAKILFQKTGIVAATIHHIIYEYTRLVAVRHDNEGRLITPSQQEGRSKGDDDLQFWYQIRKQGPDNDPSQRVLIVDEASMIGSRIATDETLHFGTDVLLDDLLTYANLGLGGKLIFIGDPAQLPPVNDNCSAALQDSFFRDKGLKVTSFELTDVIRQSEGSILLKDAMMVRDLLKATKRNALCFERKENEVMDITPSAIVERFCDIMPTPDIGAAIVICYSNSLVKDYNDAIRKRYFPEANGIVAGDVLQVVKNNVNLHLNIEFYNGDFVRVLEVSPHAEVQSAPVWKGKDGERSKVVISISFRDVTLLTDQGKKVKCKIIESLLDSRERSLNGLETVAQYINFRMRHPELNEKAEVFKDSLMEDPYYNAVQVKYGYAITAHKSQGGEWPTVFVDYSGRTGLNEDCLRWIYTATTRSQKILYGAHMPSTTPLSKLTFNAINRIAHPAKEAFSLQPVPSIDLLPDSASLAQRSKCLSAKDNLIKAGFVLSKVEMLQYVDRYTIDTPEGEVIVDCQYNGSGVYTSYRTQSHTADADKILSVLKDESNVEYAYDYTPSSQPLEQLFTQITSACDSLAIPITNIVEHASQYYVIYYLKTSGRFSQIQFYYNSSGSITHCIPSSDMGLEDLLLQELINGLKQL